MNERRIAFLLFKETGHLAHYIEYNKLSAIAKRLAKQTKRDAWRNFCTSINQNTPIKEVWQKAKAFRFNGKSQTRHLPLNSSTPLLILTPPLTSLANRIPPTPFFSICHTATPSPYWFSSATYLTDRIHQHDIKERKYWPRTGWHFLAHLKTSPSTSTINFGKHPHQTMDSLRSTATVTTSQSRTDSKKKN